MTALFWVIVSSSAIIIGLLLTFIIYTALKYKHIIRIKEVVKGRRIIRDDKACNYKDQEGVTWWRLLKEKDKEKRLIPLPPADAIDINFKGKKVVEAYRTESGEYIFLKDIGDIKELPRDIFKNIPKEINLEKDKEIKDLKIKEWKKKLVSEWREKEGAIVGYNPLTTAQRISLISNIRKAEIRRNKTWKENLPLFIGLGALVFMVVALMVFWGDIARPTLDAQQGWATIETIQLEQLNVLKEIKQGVQRIDGETEQLSNRVDNLEEKPPN